MEELRSYELEFEKELKQFTKGKNATPDEELRRIWAYLGFTASRVNKMDTLITIGVMVEGVHKGF